MEASDEFRVEKLVERDFVAVYDTDSRFIIPGDIIVNYGTNSFTEIPWKHCSVVYKVEYGDNERNITQEKVHTIESAGMQMKMENKRSWQDQATIEGIHTISVRRLKYH